MTRARDVGGKQRPQIITSVNKSSAEASTQPVDVSVINNLFVGMVLSMSWQLAVVVIAPIIGGYELDLRFGSSPVLTLIGLVIAVLGMIGVLWRTVREANIRVASLKQKEPQK